MPKAQGRITIRRRPKDGDPGTPGADSVSYYIVLSPNSISVNADGSFVCSSDSIAAKAYKNVGGVTSEATDGTMRLIFVKMDGSVADVASSGIMATVASAYASVSFEYRVNDKAVASAALSINREGQPGADAERYWLVPSSTSIIRNKTGNFIPFGISCEVMRQNGAEEPTVVTDMFVRFRFTFANELLMQWQKYEQNTSIVVLGQTRALEIELYKSGVVSSDEAQGEGAVIDRVSIPIVYDGTDGGQGKQGLQGCIYRRSKFATGFQFHNDSELETTGLRYIDLVYLMRDSSVFASQAVWFRCKKTHTSTADNQPKLNDEDRTKWDAYWEELNSLEPTYTPLLLADDAIITLMQSNQILITNDDGVVTAGFSGSNSGKKIRIWAGSQLPDDAPFRVDVLGALFSSNANITGKITATSGKIAGFNISGNSLTNGPEFDNDACIVFRNDTHHTFAGIGGNVLPATTAMRAVARFENEDSNDFWGLGRNIAMLLSAKNADINHAFLGSGNGNLDGWIGGYKYSRYQINGSNTLFSGYLKLRENNKWIVYSASTNSGVVLPSLSEVQTALGISDSTKFCVEFTILADLLSQYNFKVYGRTKLEIATNGVKTQPYFTGEYPVITHWNGGRFDNVEMASGDSLTLLLIYDSSKGGVLDTDFQLKYTARIINQQN